MMRTAIDTLLIIEKIYTTKRRSCPQLLLKPVDNFQLNFVKANQVINYLLCFRFLRNILAMGSQRNQFFGNSLFYFLFVSEGKSENIKKYVCVFSFCMLSVMRNG